MSRRDLSLEPLSRKLTVALLLGPVVALMAGLLAVYLVKGAAAVAFLLGMASVSVLTGAGKFIVLAGVSPSAPVGLLGLALMVVAMDTATAIMLVPIMPLVYRAPIIGKYLSQVRVASREVLRRNRWMRRFTLGGLIVYVAVPFGGTGAVGAVFLGRLLGLGRVAIVAGTFIGALIGGTALYGVGQLGEEYVDAMRDNAYLAVGGLAVVLVAGGLLLWRLVRVMRNGAASRTARAAGQAGGPADGGPGAQTAAASKDSGKGPGAGHGTRNGNGHDVAGSRSPSKPPVVVARVDGKAPPACAAQPRSLIAGGPAARG